MRKAKKKGPNRCSGWAPSDCFDISHRRDAPTANSGDCGLSALATDLDGRRVHFIRCRAAIKRAIVTAAVWGIVPARLACWGDRPFYWRELPYCPCAARVLAYPARGVAS